MTKQGLDVLEAEVRRLKDDIDEAWDAAGTPVRGMVTLAELIDQLKLDNAELRERVRCYELQLKNAITLVDEIQQVLAERSTA